MVKVALIDYTGKGSTDPLYAAKILAYTKNTRLNMTPEGLDRFMQMTHAQLEKELAYMATSIPSSWEFVDFTFAINDVSRACAQQITRTRQASFAMQSQRVTDMGSATCHIPDSVKNKEAYKKVLSAELEQYNAAVGAGESLEDARGLLPMNICCNLIAKYNMRAWVDLAQKRDSLRVQSEYGAVVAGMKAAVLEVMPWVDFFLQPKAKSAIELIEEVAAKLPHDEKIKLAKAADLLKGV